MATSKLGFFGNTLVLFVWALDPVFWLVAGSRKKPHDLEGLARRVEARSSRELDQVAQLEPVGCHLVIVARR